MRLAQSFQRNKSKYYLALVVLVTLSIVTRGIGMGEFSYSDATRHAMDGVFLLDFFRDLPVFHLYDYITQYYAKYPALGIGYYPPFFALVEAGFFALFGISVVSARLTVLFFALIAVIFWFKLVKEVYQEETALFSSLLLITTPFVVQWSKTPMLEMPALAMIILSVYFFHGFFELKKQRYGLYVVLATAAAIYTKQTSIFLLLLFFLYLMLTKHRGRLLERDVILWGVLLFLLILPLVLITLKYGQMNLDQSIGTVKAQSRLLVLKHWVFYPKALLKIMTPLLVLLSLVTMCLSLSKKNYLKAILFFSWVLGYYITFSYINIKEPRYIYFWLPPFTLFAALFVEKIPWRVRRVPAAAILLTVLVFYQYSLSLKVKNPYVSGYAEAAKYILSKDPGSVLFQGSGEGNGNFIFQIRKGDPDRKMIVFRGDKIFTSSALFPGHLLVEHVKSVNEARAKLDAYGANYVVIEENADYNIAALKMFREVLNSRDYTLVHQVKIDTNLRKHKGESLLIYHANQSRTLKSDKIHMRLPIVGSEISVSLRSLSDFYTPSKERHQGADLPENERGR